MASSRIRCATVIASVLAITKLPTNRAMPPKPSRKYLKTLSPAWVSLLSAPPARRRSSPASFRRAAGGSGGSTRRRHALFGADTDEVELALLVEQPLCGREVENRDLSPAIEPSDPKLTIPLTRYFATGPSPNAPTVWPSAKCCSSAVDLSIAIWPSPRGHSPSTSLSGFRPGRPEGSMPSARPSSALPDRLAVLVDEPRLVLDRALGDTHAGQALDLVEHGGRERRRLGGSRRSS